MKNLTIQLLIEGLPLVIRSWLLIQSVPSLDVCQPWCLGFWHFMATYFNTIVFVSTFYEYFWWTGMSPRGW